MIACLESLSLANVSNIIRSVASVLLEASEGDKEEEFSAKNLFWHFLHSHAMQAAHRAYLFADVDSLCA
jgi:hypothetical protein